MGNYNGVGAKLSQRFGNNLTSLISYTFSRSLDDSSAIRGPGNDFVPPNARCRSCDYGPSDFNIPQRLVASVLYTLPFGRGQRLLESRRHRKSTSRGLGAEHHHPDSQKLVARLSGDMDLARKIVAGFLGDAPGQLQKLRLAIQQADINGIRSQAHLLKGAADTVSALALRDLSMEILRAVADADLSRVASLAPGLEEQFEKLKTTVSQSGWA